MNLEVLRGICVAFDFADTCRQALMPELCGSSCFAYLYDLATSWRMGIGSSSDAKNVSEEEKEAQELENRLKLDLPFLKSAFSRLSSSELEDIFAMEADRIRELPSEDQSDIRKLLPHLGPAVALFFKTEGNQLKWTDFLKGFNECCHQSLATKLRSLLSFFRELQNRAGIFSKIEADDKLEGQFSERELRDFFWVCWLLMYYGRVNDGLELVDVKPLVSGASACSQEVSLEAAYSWMTSNIPCVANALATYVRVRLQNVEGVPGTSSVAFSGLLTPGRAWALGLSQKDHIGDVLLSAFYQNQLSLLYRSSNHGKGMNRFWSQVEGYRAPAVLLFSVLPPEGGSSWVIGVIFPSGLENKSSFQGNSNFCLIAMGPKFGVFRTTGREKNHAYTYKAVAGGGYNSKPMPNGIGFGGTLGNERLWLDDDFSTLTLRHYAVDKSYQAGFLTPIEGYAPVNLQLLEVDLWGLGGKDAEEHMLEIQKRENLFAEQRRKVDLKAFGNWQDSPEKMMMDMVSDPNKAQREDR